MLDTLYPASACRRNEIEQQEAERQRTEQEAKEIAQREEADEPAAGSSGRMSDSKITAPVTTDDVEMAVPTAQA